MRPGANSSLVLSSLVFEYSCDAMILVDSECIVRALNPAAQELLGWRDDMPPQASCWSVVGCRPERAARGADMRACLCQEVLRLHHAVTWPRHRIRPSGRRELTVSASCSPLPVDHLGGAVVIVRRLEEQEATLAAGELRAGRLRMDVARHQVFVEGRLLHLTPTDFAVLRYLLVNAGRVVSRQELIEHVWQYQDVNDRDLIKAHVAVVRQKLREAGLAELQIENVYGVGYILNTAPPEPASFNLSPTPGSAGDWW